MHTWKLIIISILITASTGCGISIGNSAIGTTGFLAEHNRKVKMLATQEQLQEVHNAKY